MMPLHITLFVLLLTFYTYFDPISVQSAQYNTKLHSVSADLVSDSTTAAAAACQYKGQDYSGLANLPDFTFTVDNPCGFPTGRTTFIISLCRPVNSSAQCQALGATACAISEDSGIVTPIGNLKYSTISPVYHNNQSYGLTFETFSNAIQATMAMKESNDDPEINDSNVAAVNIYCPKEFLNLPNPPRAIYSPWLPGRFTTQFTPVVNAAGQCNSVDLSIMLNCVCPNSNGCPAALNPLPPFPVSTNIPSAYPAEYVAPGPNGTIFSTSFNNRTLWVSMPKSGQPGSTEYVTKPFARSPSLFNMLCMATADTENGPIVFVGTQVENGTGTLILAITQDDVREFVWFPSSYSSLIQSIAYSPRDRSLYAGYSSDNMTLSSILYQYPIDKPGTTYHHYYPQLGELGELFIDSSTHTLYASYSSGLWIIDLTTYNVLQTVPFQDYNMFLGMTFWNSQNNNNNDKSNDHSHTNPLPLAVFQDQSYEPGLGNQFPNCNIYAFNISGTTLASQLQYKGQIPECGSIVTTMFFYDSFNQLWITDFAMLLQVQL